MKKWLVGILLAVFSTFAQAGFMEKNWRLGSTEEMCAWAAREVGYAIDRRIVNVPLILKDKDDLPPNHNPNLVPRDALYINNWNTLDDEDKAFYSKFIKLGYAIAERKLKENPDAKFPEDFGSDYSKFMAACYESKNNPENLFKEIVKTGSGKPFTEKEISQLYNFYYSGINEKLYICQELQYDIRTIARAVSEGEPLEDMIALAQRSVDVLRPERLARILRMLPEAYEYKGPIVDWMNKEYKECNE